MIMTADPRTEFLEQYHALVCRFGWSINGGTLEPLPANRPTYYFTRATPSASIQLRQIKCQNPKPKR